MTVIHTAAALAASSVPTERIGGKAAGLVSLMRLGMPVPPFFVVDAEALGDGVLSDAVIAGVEAALAELPEGPVAVRSSAAAEDGKAASWAGQFETVLGVEGLDAVLDAIRTCVASARSERVRAYAAAQGVSPGPMAVVVQSMVVGDVSGVLFTRDPDHPDRALISAGLGLGEGVVQGVVPCDTFHVDDDGTIHAILADKDSAVRLVDGVPTERPVEGDARTAPALPDEVIRHLARLGRTLEDALGGPQDVEFTVRDGQVTLLQVRPITVPIPRGRRLLWDNSNIVESYSGITTPLTFSFANAVYTIVYQLFCRVMGVRDEVIRENVPVFRRMIGLVRGRIYYNLNAWYRLIQLLPGYQFNRGAMETMMGVSEVASDTDAGASQSRWVAGLELGRLAARLGWRLLWIERDAARFQRTFDAALARGKALDLDGMRLDELLDHYETIERELLWAWTPPLVNDFFCMIFYKLLHKQCVELTGDPDTQLHNELLAGEDVASAAPAKELLTLARYAANIDLLRAALLSGRPDREVMAELRRHPGFAERFERWLDRYGDRSPDELKLESATLRDTPEFLLGTLRAFARDPRNVREFGAAERATRAAAEEVVQRRLSGFLAARRFDFVLRQARRRVAMRESLRFERTRIFGHVRNIFRAFGDRLVEVGRLSTRDDVFYLTVDELLGFVRGTTATTDLQGLVDLRRAEFERYRTTEPAPDERFWTWGAVHVHNRFTRPTAAPPAPRGDELVGTPCSPGRVTGIARVVRDPREVPDLGGAILVAHRTDPGWVPLYPTASAILVERGSLLSHSAVIARELGLPAIVGARGLLAWIEDGETIGLDGATGRIWKVGDEDA